VGWFAWHRGSLSGVYSTPWYRSNMHLSLYDLKYVSCTTHLESLNWKLLKVKGSGAEARAEGPFLRWQNRSGEAAKSAERERGDPSPPPRAGKRKVPTSGSSDSAGAESSVTAAKHPQG